MILPTFYPFAVLDAGLLRELRQRVGAGVHEFVEFRAAPTGLTITRSEIIGHFKLLADSSCDGSRPTSSRAGGHMGYAVPPDWLHIEPGEPRNFADQFDKEFE